MAKAILAYLETALVKDPPNANVSNRRSEPHSETAPAWSESLREENFTRQGCRPAFGPVAHTRSTGAQFLYDPVFDMIWPIIAT